MNVGANNKVVLGIYIKKKRLGLFKNKKARVN